MEILGACVDYTAPDWMSVWLAAMLAGLISGSVGVRLGTALGRRQERRASAEFEREHGNRAKGLYQGCNECGTLSEHDVLVHVSNCSHYRTTRIFRMKETK